MKKIKKTNNKTDIEKKIDIAEIKEDDEQDKETTNYIG